MKKTLYAFMAAALLASCSPVEKDYYVKYFDGYSFKLDSVTDEFGPTVWIGTDGISFIDGVMKTYTLSNPAQSNQAHYRVSHDTLFVGPWQSYKIVSADESKIVYQYHTAIETGTDKWKFTYHLTRIVKPDILYDGPIEVK